MKRLRSRRHSTIQPLLRAITVIAAVATLATGVTFAALQSQQAVLSGNTIETATADLRIGVDGSTFASSHDGFDFSDVVPGGPAVPATGNVFYLKNSGTPALKLHMAVSSTPTNTSNVDLSHVFLVLTREGSDAPQKLALDQLVSSSATGGLDVTDSLAGGAAAKYTLQVQMDADAFSGQQADIGDIDVVFTGAAVTE